MKIDIKQTVEVIGLVSVVASLTFVGFEIRQNTVVARAQARDSISDKLINWELMVATDQAASEVWSKGNRGDPLERDGEYSSYQLIVNAQFSMWENEFYQYKLGLFEEEEFIARMVRWERSIVGLAGYRDQWNRQRNVYERV